MIIKPKKIKFLFIIVFTFFFNSCQDKKETKEVVRNTTVVKTKTQLQIPTQTSIVILGTVQDAGSPHIACKKDCCKDLFENPDADRKVVSLGVVDPENAKKYLFEATPDMPMQMKLFKRYSAADSKETADGIFLTHAHIGHYTGLMFLGKEAMNAKSIPVFAMPTMKNYLETNGPWSQLVSNSNIVLHEMENEKQITLTDNLKVTPYTVPHRDEYSETVGYTITGPNKSALFIPDIDKWGKWEKNIINEISKVDYAFIDATFFDANEVGNRDMSEIPHPFIVESMSLFKNLTSEEKSKIIFIHFNHSNPALNSESIQSKEILENGFKIARVGGVYAL
ncbi:MAG: MBL fold metallo-hydrolase [Cellulophaga sp.]